MAHRTEQRDRHRLLAACAAVLVLTAACGGSSGYGGSSSTTTSSKPASSASQAQAASAAALGTASTKLGTILVDAHGKTLYAFAIDSKGHSACMGSCLQYWPPVPAGSASPKAPAGVTAKLGVLHRTDGTAQLTVNGFPMYTYVGDKGPGSTAGQGLNLSGGLWYVVAPDGDWVKSSSGEKPGEYGSATPGSSMSSSSSPRGY